jgi:hypothetical protein
MKEKRADRREDNLEVSAVEIKYFKKYQRRWIKKMVQDDVEKLSIYLKPGVEPKADNGFFICVDDSGEAEGHLKELFAQRRLKNQRIGYFVIVPKYVVEQRKYPMRLEEYERGYERSSAYVMDKALGMLKSDFPSLTKEKLTCDRVGKYKQSAGPGFYIRCGRERIGWVDFDWLFRNGRRTTTALIVRLYDETQHVGGDWKSVKWDDKCEGYYYSEKQGERRVYFVRKRNYQYDLNKMNRIADEIYYAVRKILLKAERTQT